MGDCLGDWRTTFSAKIIQIKRCPEIETENWNGNEEGKNKKEWQQSGRRGKNAVSKGIDGLLMECNYIVLLKSQPFAKVHPRPLVCVLDIQTL